MFSTYKKYENDELLREIEIQTINNQLANNSIILDTKLLTTKIQDSIEKICYNTEHTLSLNSKENIGHLIGEYTYEYYDNADVVITEIPQEELERQIMKHRLLNTPFDCIHTPDEGVYISSNETILAFKKLPPDKSKYENIQLEIRTSDIQTFRFNGRNHHFVELAHVNLNKIQLNSGYTVAGEKAVMKFIDKQINYYNILKSKQALLLGKIYKSYLLKDILSCLRARNSNMSTEEIINYSNNLTLSPKQIEKEIKQLVKTLNLRVENSK